MDEQEKVLFKYLKKYPKNLTIKRIKNHLKSKKMTKTKEIITKKYIKKFCINHKLENVFGKESILLKKLKKYLQNNIGNVIKIQNIRKELGVNRIQNIFITSNYISNFAKKNEIPIILLYDKSMKHGLTYWRKTKCQCNICKLSVRVKFKMKTNCRVTDYIAHKYEKKYKLDQSPRKRNFYEFLNKNLEKIKDEMRKKLLNTNTVVQRRNK